MITEKAGAVVTEETAETDEQEPVVIRNGFFERKIVPFVGRNRSWQLGVVITFFFMIIVAVIMGVAPFGMNSFSTIDSMHQYVPFFSEFQQKLRGGESLFYTWDVGMGQNYLSLLMYYIACPLNLIMIFFTRKGIFAAFTVLVVFKISFSAGAFGYWLSRRRSGKPSNNWLIPAFSVAFALCNYMIGYNWNLMWLDCIMVLPLVTLGMERIFRNESPRMF
ncbi:MAG: YfhO family protein, partial [Eubacterium sp.]|nr:YfhO family protein [Eubacterium sp.]